MNIGYAVAIFKSIKSEAYTVEEKGEAIMTVLKMETDNSIYKRDYKEALDWLFNEHFEVKEAADVD